MSRLWILGAPDPEMAAIDSLLRECGETVVYATAADGVRVHPGTAYRAATALVGETDVVYLVECDAPLAYGSPEDEPDVCQVVRDGVRYADAREIHECCVVVIDHHRPGDPGFGRGPEEFMRASSLGQVIAELAQLDRLPGSWAEAVEGRSGYGWYGQSVPRELVMTAAADHCLGAAYRGECPGVAPDELMRFRAEQRAAFQGRPVEAVLADVEASTAALRAAPSICIGRLLDPPLGPDYDITVRDMRTCPVCDGRGGACGASGSDGYDPSGPCHSGPRGPYPELVEAATRLGVGYISGPLAQPDGRRKVTCSGSSEQVEAWLKFWAPGNGIVDTYGDPERGFAGGYLPMTCLDCPSPAAPNHHLCNRCHERRADERAEANEERACAKMDGEREMPRGLMWGDE